MTMISIRHKTFADEYLNNGRNATRAYMTVYKPLKVLGAEASSARLLSDAKVRAYIAKVDASNLENNQISKQKYLDFMDSIVQEAKTAPATILLGDIKDRALNAIKIIGKWQGYESATQIEVLSIKEILKSQEDEDSIEL